MAIMNEWMITTQNDPLGAVRQVARTLWENANLTRMLLPQNGGASYPGPGLIEDPEQIKTFNPFTPLMPFNAAERVPDLISGGGRVAAVLRPCELRTLNAMLKRKQLTSENLLTMSVDCLGTLPVDEFQWRAQRKGASKGLAQEALQFARQGGIVPYRYRAACQICESPEATEADITIGVLGLPVRQYLLIKIQDEQIAQYFDVSEKLPVDEVLSTQHRRVADRLAERGQSTRQRIFHGLVDVLPANIDNLVEPVQNCDDCRACLDACPICTSEFPRRDANGKYARDEVMEWLISCSGCGICDQNCPKHLPLTIIFGHIRNQLAEG